MDNPEPWEKTDPIDDAISKEILVKRILRFARDSFQQLAPLSVSVRFEVGTLNRGNFQLDNYKLHDLVTCIRHAVDYSWLSNDQLQRLLSYPWLVDSVRLCSSVLSHCIEGLSCLASLLCLFACFARATLDKYVFSTADSTVDRHSFTLRHSCAALDQTVVVPEYDRCMQRVPTCRSLRYKFVRVYCCSLTVARGENVEMLPWRRKSGGLGLQTRLWETAHDNLHCSIHALTTPMGALTAPDHRLRQRHLAARRGNGEAQLHQSSRVKWSCGPSVSGGPHLCA